ncbi:hypothetical protein ASD58_30050 [Duganella sp. Root1480D1]|nr:hypothetical protein ASD58_30050 [Duganella sp. Root1480D1]
MWKAARSIWLQGFDQLHTFDFLLIEIRQPNSYTVFARAFNDIFVRESRCSQDIKERSYVTWRRRALIHAPTIKMPSRLNQLAHSNEFVFLEWSRHWGHLTIC